MQRCQFLISRPKFVFNINFCIFLYLRVVYIVINLNPKKNSKPVRISRLCWAALPVLHYSLKLRSYGLQKGSFQINIILRVEWNCNVDFNKKIGAKLESGTSVLKIENGKKRGGERHAGATKGSGCNLLQPGRPNSAFYAPYIFKQLASRGTLKSKRNRAHLPPSRTSRTSWVNKSAQ